MLFFVVYSGEHLDRSVILLKSMDFLCRGALGQNLFLKCLTLTSATFVSAMINLVPAITFVLAIFLR